MLALSSAHNHTTFCDGKSTAEEMVLSALSRGFVSLGFSGHAKQDFDHFYAMDEETEAAYIRQIRQLQSKYAGQIRLWLGMERDLYSNADRSPFDYVIGSVHYVPLSGGKRVPVDGPMDMVAEAVRSFFGGSGIAYAQAYYKLLGEYIRVYRPDIIGHFDLLIKNSLRGELFDPESPAYIKAATDAMDEALEGCGMMEVNTGGMARYGATVPFPSESLLRYWREIGGQVILAGDCHEASLIAYGFEKAEEMIRRAGYQKAAIMGRHQDLFDWVELN